MYLGIIVYSFTYLLDLLISLHTIAVYILIADFVSVHAMSLKVCIIAFMQWYLCNQALKTHITE